MRQFDNRRGGKLRTSELGEAFTPQRTLVTHFSQPLKGFRCVKLVWELGSYLDVGKVLVLFLTEFEKVVGLKCF